MALHAMQTFRFRVSRFFNSHIANSACRCPKKQGKIGCARRFHESEMFGEPSPRVPLGHQVQKEGRPMRAISVLEVHRIADRQRAKIANRFTRREFLRSYPYEVIEVIVDDRRALIACVVIFYLKRRSLMPLTIKMDLKR
ncbi:hypothetical protein [Rhizobium sp. SG570]|uniref:hypothetical protein n=1 Tax=Rhizobium sp. SG570 TaxID=2587113 RepID=UPI001831760D|nr:hypothetical protein [Rhizobium sp. SG570]NKJ39442.1 hypothetical protein [Rhizobium sp. SG570]